MVGNPADLIRGVDGIITPVAADEGPGAATLSNCATVTVLVADDPLTLPPIAEFTKTYRGALASVLHWHGVTKRAVWRQFALPPVLYTITQRPTARVCWSWSSRRETIRTGLYKQSSKSSTLDWLVFKSVKAAVALPLAFQTKPSSLRPRQGKVRCH